MSKYIPGNQKHLTLNDRIYIENEHWQKGLPLKTLQHFYVKIQQLYLKKSVLIGFQIGITKVLFITQRTFAFIVTIVKRPMPVEKFFSVALNVPHVLPVISPARTLKKERCKRLDKAPYVCNGCTKKINHCTIAHKYYYNGRAADRKYRELLISSRSGINMTKHQLHQKDQIISPLIEQGQSPYQILTNHPELDTVHSSRESNKTLLTLFFTKEKLFLAFLLNRCTKGAVRLTFDRLEKRLGTYEFISVFENILTDRGSEFGDPVSLETGIQGIQRSSIYYCDPMRSGQKGAIEQAHTMLRMVLPKGTSFEVLTQWDVNIIVNHINSTPREILSGRTPYEVALETLGEDILKAFQLKPIEPDKVNLTPKLIRFNH